MMMHQARGSYSGGAVGLAGGSSGAGRDVIFRLTVQPDPKAVRVMRMFGEDIRREQAIISNAAIRSAKDALTQWEKTGREQVQIFQNVQNVGTASATQIGQAWRATGTTIQRALQNAQQLASVPTPAVPAPGAAPAGGGAGYGGGSYLRAGRGIEQILMGSVGLARSAALFGMVGEQDTQKLLDTLLKVEGTVSLLHQSLQVGRGVNRLLGLGGAAGSAGALGLGAGLPFTAALLGVGLAGYTAYDLSRDPSFHGRSTKLPAAGERPGFGSFIGSYISPFVGGEALAYGLDPNAGDQRTMMEQRRDVFRSYERVQRQQEHIEAMRQNQLATSSLAGRYFQSEDAFLGGRYALRGEMAALSGADTSARLRLNALSLGEARGVLSQRTRDIGQFSNANVFGPEGATLAAKAQVNAMTQVKNLIAEQISLTKQLAQERIKSAQDELNKAKELVRTRTSAFEGKIGTLRSDLATYGGLDAETQRQVFYSARQLRAGEDITSEQEQLLSQFSEFRDTITQRQIQRGYGLGGEELFAGGYAGAREAQRLKEQAMNSVKEAEAALKASQQQQQAQEAGIVKGLIGEFIAIVQRLDADRNTDRASLKSELTALIREGAKNRATITGR